MEFHASTVFKVHFNVRIIVTCKIGVTLDIHRITPSKVDRAHYTPSFTTSVLLDWRRLWLRLLLLRKLRRSSQYPELKLNMIGWSARYALNCNQ